MKKIFYIFIFILVIIATLTLVYVLKNGTLPFLSNTSKMQAILNKGKIAGYDVRLLKYYLTKNKLSRDEVVLLAKKDCLSDPALQTNSSDSYTRHFEYIQDLKRKILLKMGLNPDGEQGLLFFYDNVPDTNACLLIWVVDAKGYGAVGYETTDGKILLHSSIFPKDKLDPVLNGLKN